MSRHRDNLRRFIMSITALIAVVLLYIPAQSRDYHKPISKAVTLKQNRDTLIKQTDTSKKASDTTLLSAEELKILAKETRYKERVKERKIKDSIKGVKDSIRWSIPRMLDTYIVDDSLKYKRLITWKHDNYLNKITFVNPDTTYRENFNDYPFMRRDVGAAYLGVVGSATQLHNYFKREKLDIFEPFEPYLVYSYTPANLRFYNVKTPYTEFGYWGTLFANREKEESNIKILHTQNLSPSFNMTFSYERFGGKGLLGRESTDNRTLALYANYLGRRYVMHSGFISQGVKREENGGIINDTMVTDTTVEDSKTLEYRLESADNHLKRKTFFLTHSYGIPIRIFKSDTLKSGEGTTTYFGHSFEYSTYSKKYTDEIGLTDSVARALYNNMFLMSPTTTFDSIRVNNIENRFFLRLQPWAKEAIISRLDGGIGYQILGIYNFRPEFYISNKSNTVHNNVYLYFGADGNFRKYFRWDAFARYYLSGYYANNFKLDAKAGFSLYPHKEGIHFTGRLLLENRRPNWFSSSYYSNHYSWENNFTNITETKIEGHLNMPKYKLSLFAGYSLINNPIYYGMQGIAAQHSSLISILSAYIQKNFTIGFLHLDNRLLYQLTSNSEVLPLPAISANLRYYMQFQLVKNVLTAQLGADVTFHSEYYSPSYSPALGIFHNQNDRKIGNYPYIDAFVNLQWKRTSIFVKYVNATQGWPDGDYFSAHHYIRPEKAIKFGIHWPFYVK